MRPLPILVILALSGALNAQAPTRGSQLLEARSSGGRSRFVDFSDHLDWAQTSVVVGTLGKFKDGKKKRIDSSKAHSGGVGSVVRMSGTQYFEAKTRTKLAVDDCAAGKVLKGKVPLSFRVQLTRLPDGSVKRMVLGAERHDLAEGMRALFVLDREPKKKGHQIAHVIPMKAGQKKADFARDVADFVAVNRRLAELRRAHTKAKRVAVEDAEKIIATIDALLEQEIEFENSANESLQFSVLRPWEQRLEKQLGKLRGPGG